jgi:hypothetical protein
VEKYRLVKKYKGASRGGGRATPQQGSKGELSACRGEGSAVGLQLRVRFVPAALLAVLTKDCTGSPVCF